jgi:hypothetical protein
LVRGFVAPDATTVRAASAAASFAVDGFARERACRALGGFLPWSIRLLVIRATDWVPEVRGAALDALSGVVAHDFARHVGLVEQLSAARARTDGLDRLVNAVLISTSGLSELSQLRNADDQLVRRAAWNLLMRWLPERTTAQLADAARDPDPWLRHWAQAHAGAGGITVEWEVARAMRRDPVGRLRARALRTEINLGGSGDPFLTDALSDQSAAVRAVAQHHLRASGVEIRALYRTRLAAKPKVGDILGIGEVGEPSDAGLVRRWLADPRARYRQAALISGAHLAGGDIDTAAAALDDPSPRVARTGVRLLGASRLPSTLVAQMEARAATGSPSVRRSALVVLRPYPWPWLLAVLRCHNAPDEETRRFAREELARGRIPTTAPSADTADAVLELLPSVNKKSAELIEWVLRTTGRR